MQRCRGGLAESITPASYRLGETMRTGRERHMRRRDFIKAIAGSAAEWPFAARAQQPAMPVIGFIRNTTRDDSADLLKAMHQGLRQTGYVEGTNVVVEYRFADNQLDRLPTMAADLVRRQVAVIVTGGRCFIICGQGSNDNHSGHLFDRFRPNRNRPRDQPKPTGRQHHGRKLFQHARNGSEATRSPGPADAERRHHRLSKESE